MENTLPLSREEEFWMITGVVLRNWTALQIGLNESRERLDVVRSKVERMLQMVCEGIASVKANKLVWEDVADNLGDCLNEMFDILLDDDSDTTVVCHLIELSQLVDENNRAAIIQAMSQFQDRRHILSGELYQPQRVIRKGEPNVPFPDPGINSAVNIPVKLQNARPVCQDVPTPGSTVQYSVFQPTCFSGLGRDTKLDRPEEMEDDDSSSGSENEEKVNGKMATLMETSSSSQPKTNPEDEWTVVGRRKKKHE